MYRRFGNGGSCAGCLRAISPDEMVLKLNQRAYHPNCFTCVVCKSRLTSGDRFRLVNGHIVCEHHNTLMLNKKKLNNPLCQG